MNDFTGLGTGTGFDIAVLLQFVDNAAGAAEPEPEFPLKHGNGNNVLVREPVENDIIHFIVPAVVFVEVRFKGCIAVFAEIDLVIGTALFFQKSTTARTSSSVTKAPCMRWSPPERGL